MDSPVAPPVTLSPPPRRPLWRRLLKWFLWVVASAVSLVLVLVLVAWWLWSSGRLLSWGVARGAAETERTAPSDRPWPPPGIPPGVQPPDAWPGPRCSLTEARTAAEFYRATNVWEVELVFSAREWKDIQVRPNPPGFKLGPSPKKFPLRNPEAARNGLAGVLGMSQPWSTAQVRVGGTAFTNVAVRLKGNGTFLDSLASIKKPFKIDFGRGAKGRDLAGFQVLNLNNLKGDFSYVSDTLAYAFYRRAGVPAPRTAYGRVLLGIEGQFQRRPIGLYVLVENADETWAKDAFPGRNVVLFKPVTYELFADLGTDWSAYDAIYDPKTPPTEKQQRRVMDTARFVTGASSDDFAAHVDEYFDLTEVARFVVVTSLISSYDGFLNNGQNFVMYLDDESGRFGFIPWDLDRAWGEFPLLGTRPERETASLFHPWVADHRLLQRLFAVPSFQALYRREVERIFREQFDVPRLREQVRQLAPLIRPTVLEEADYRVDRFDRSLEEKWPDSEPEPNIADPFRPVHRIHRFLVRRAESVEAQLAGREKGHEFHERPDMGQEPPKPPARPN